MTHRKIIEQMLEALDGTEALLSSMDVTHLLIYSEVEAAITAARKYLAAPDEQVPPFGSKRKAAMAVYTPPFVYKYGYIYDSQNLMVADNGGIGKDEPCVEGAVAARVRGWGRLGYLPNGAELQDEIGQMMADALTALYSNESQLAAARQQGAETRGTEDAQRVAQQAMKIASLEYQLSEAKGLLEAQDIKEHQVRRVMARLANLLDEDQFAEIEGIVTAVGFRPALHFDNTEALRQYGEGEEP